MNTDRLSHINTNDRCYTLTDRVCFVLDNFVRTVFGTPLTISGPSPATDFEAPELTEAEKRLSARLMRVNYCGEVCAQALYQGQAMTARDEVLREQLLLAAEEENNHLFWCNERLQALESHRSYLNLLFYLGALGLGMTVGLFGDNWSLGFVAETECQVEQHLTRHLDQLPRSDHKSLRVVEKMRDDERRHAQMAIDGGAKALPGVIKQMMCLMALAMTQTTYWL